LINSVNSWLVGILSIAAAIMFIIAGFRIVTAQGNPSVLKSAKDMITNVAIGFMIVLAAWLFVDFLMKALLDDGQSQMGPWNTIACVDQPTARTDPGEVSITMVQTTTSCYSTDDCATKAAECNSRNDASSEVVGTTGSLAVDCSYTDTTGRVTPGGRGEAQCAPENTNCNVAFLSSLGLTDAQANVMSCVAVTENSGGAVGCSGTGPCGTFQITKTNWRIYTEGSNAEHPQCSASNFGGDIEAAQNNGPCNARVMASMVRVSGYQPWTGAHSGQAPWNPYARGCVNSHSNASDSTNRAF
jgi:hypothetical protein